MAPANCLKLWWRVSLLHKMLVRALFYLLVLTVDHRVKIWILHDACKRQTRNLIYVFLTALSKFMWIPTMECVKCKKKKKGKLNVLLTVVYLIVLDSALLWYGKTFLFMAPWSFPWSKMEHWTAKNTEMRFLIQFKNKFCLPKIPILFNWKIMHVRIVQTLLTKTFSKRLSRDWDDLSGHETRILSNMYGMFYSGRCNNQIQSIKYQWAWRCFVGRIRWHLHPFIQSQFHKAKPNC